MTAAAIYKWDVLNRLVANNERLEITNATTLSEIKTLLTNAEKNGGGSTARSALAAAGGSATSEVSTLKLQVQKL